MGYLAYKLIAKTPEVDASRRSALDWYANLAQLSQVLFILAIPFSKFTLAILSNFLRNGNNSDYNVKKDKESVPKSSQKSKTLGLSRTKGDMKSFLDKEVMKGYGTYEQWIFGLGWATWLIFLCINDTAPGV